MCETMSSVDRVILKCLPHSCWCDPPNFQYLCDILSGWPTSSQQKPTGIQSNYDPSSVKTLAIDVLTQLCNSSPSKDNEVLLKRTDGDQLVLQLLMSCLGAFTNQYCDSQFLPLKPPPQQLSNKYNKVQHFAKGTGFSIDSITETWNVHQTILHQKCTEQHITVLLQMLSNYINPGGLTTANTQPLPAFVHDQLLQSCLLNVLSSYLSNDSVLDMAKRIPLYRSVMQLLRALAQEKQLLSLLKYHKTRTVSILSLLLKMNTVIETYASQLNVISKCQDKVKSDEDLLLLIPDIQYITDLVQTTKSKLGYEKDAENLECSKQEVLLEKENCKDEVLVQEENCRKEVPLQKENCKVEIPVKKSLEQRYLEAMKPLQFVTYEMTSATSNGKGFLFMVPYHFTANVKVDGDHSHPARVKRLAQELATLNSSLPLSFSSSVFVCCDADRMDIMKVLITGPADTPYANGCFVLDVYFPPDYPNTPMLINLETTGGKSVRFNPNLYIDGKVCLSILNTWPGHPEEQWNPQLSNLLQVLVSIQSLIMVPEPFFNEPIFVNVLGTPIAEESSSYYNYNIKWATTKWAMLEQLRNPPPCFKQVIETHFWIKRKEIKSQIKAWITDMETFLAKRPSIFFIDAIKIALKTDYQQLCAELAKLKPQPKD